jgi:hypothetical protein
VRNKHSRKSNSVATVALVDAESLLVIRAVVASPGDVTPERNIVERVAAEANRGIAAALGVHLQVVRWEKDAFPSFHPAGPQGAIDPVLDVSNCDVFIGIFWKRFGTPTADAMSGTEHEFAEAYEAWRIRGRPQIMLYFNQKPYTPTTAEEIEQWRLVLDFQRRLPSEGLWWKYRGVRDFERLLRGHIAQALRVLAAKYKDGNWPGAVVSGSGMKLKESVAYEVFALVSKELSKAVEHALRSSNAESLAKNSGCQRLFHLHASIEELSKWSRKFVTILAADDRLSRLDELAKAHGNLARGFDEAMKDAVGCLRGVGIFDEELRRLIERYSIGKGARLRYWNSVLTTAAGTMRDTAQLPDLRAAFDRAEATHDLWGARVERNFQALMSLHDESAVQAAVADAEARIRELDLVAQRLAAFIRSHCEFADLF